VAACSLLSSHSMFDGWFRGLWLYFEDDVEYFVDALILLHVYR
jgi:hypothetical protein